MNKFLVAGSVEQTFCYIIEANSTEEAQVIAAQKACEDFGNYDAFNVNYVYEDGGEPE